MKQTQETGRWWKAEKRHVRTEVRQKKRSDIGKKAMEDDHQKARTAASPCGRLNYII